MYKKKLNFTLLYFTSFFSGQTTKRKKILKQKMMDEKNKKK